MKKNTHPKYQQVLFVDSSTGTKFICGSTLQCEGTEKFEGKEYPVYHVATSSASHPFFTGSKQFVDAEGRVDKFMKKYAGGRKTGGQSKDEQGAKEEKKEEKAEKAPKAAKTKKK